MELTLEGIAQRVGAATHLYALDLTLVPRAVTVLLGATQAGKTTLKRVMAGLDAPSAGRVVADGRDVTGMPVRERNVAMVYQQFINYPSMTVFDNIASPLKLRREQGIEARVQELAAKLHIEPFLKRLPAELSGGQQQRVALARALAPQPRLLLLDEPFSNLDVELREQLAGDVRSILKASGTAAVFVTHDQNEAFAMADQVAVMHGGRIEQLASAWELYHRPNSRFVADFIGQGVFVTGRLLDSQRLQLEIGEVASPVPIRFADSGAACATGSALQVLLRPDDVLHDDASPVRARVVHKAFRGPQILYTLALDGGDRVLAMVPSHHNHALNEPIGIRLEMDHVIAFAPLAAVQAAA